MAVIVTEESVMRHIVRLTSLGLGLCCMVPGAAASAQAVPASGPPLGAKVTETLLGPKKQGGQFVVSPDGGHMAVASMHGSREIIILDGVEGPDFDRAAHESNTLDIDVVFSPDGKRSAYMAQKGDQLVAVLDGKEAFVVVTSVKPGPGYGSVLGIPGEWNRTHPFLFSPSGAHLAVANAESPGGSHMFLDGVKGPGYLLLDLKQMAFAGEKLIYAAQTPDNKWHMVVNDKPGPAYDQVLSLEVSDNHQHYAFIGRTGGTSVVVADGVASTARPNVVSGSGLHNLVLASNGRVAYFGYTGNGPYKEPLYVGDQEISPETSTFAGPPSPQGMAQTAYVVFSPDGNKFAYTKPVPGGIAAIIDGKPSQAYDHIGAMAFGPDSRRAYFVGLKNVIGNFVVIDGQEMAIQNTVKNFVFSQDGSRFGYEAYLAQAGFSMVVDGKQSAQFLNLVDNSLAFSADGKHSAYAGCTNYGQCQLVADGAVTKLAGLGTFTSRTRPSTAAPPVFFSPDGSRLVYLYPKADGTNQSVIVLNGQEVARGTNFAFPSFSPDSKHFAVISWTGKGYTVLADGKVGPTYDEIFEANGNVVRFEDAHTLRLLGVKGGSVYRVLVTLN